MARLKKICEVLRVMVCDLIYSVYFYIYTYSVREFYLEKKHIVAVDEGFISLFFKLILNSLT